MIVLLKITNSTAKKLKSISKINLILSGGVGNRERFGGKREQGTENIPE